jgi:hypothetical protein
MATIYNNNIIRRTAFANITIPGAASATSSVSTGVYIPKGAIVTAVRWNSQDAVTIANASATAVIRVGTVPLFTALAVSAWGAQTVPISSAISNAAGIAVTADSEINLLIQASSNTSAVASYDVYVDYLYCSGHE